MTAMSPEATMLAGSMLMAERWSMPSSVEHGYLMADPLTGQQLDVNRPPVWIEHDPELAAGFDYLRRNNANITVSALFVYHATAEDLGDPNKGWFERQVAAADFYGYENVGFSKAEHAKSQKAVESIIGSAVLANQVPSLALILNKAEQYNVTTYSMRTFAAAALLGTPGFPIDILSDGSAAEQAVLRAADSVVEHPDRHVAGIAFLGFQNAREWIVLARLGLELQSRFGELKAPINGFITFGDDHRDLARKSRKLGVTMKPKMFASLASDPHSVDYDVSGIQGSSIVLPDELAVVRLYADTFRAHFRKSPLVTD